MNRRIDRRGRVFERGGIGGIEGRDKDYRKEG